MHVLVVRVWRSRRTRSEQRTIGVAVAPEVGMEPALVTGQGETVVRHEKRGNDAGGVEERYQIREHGWMSPLDIDGETNGVSGEAIGPTRHARRQTTEILAHRWLAKTGSEYAQVP